ncbi:MAG TPA: CehA/McbA family metallohydrolase [Acidobacteriota bacterium]
MAIVAVAAVAPAQTRVEFHMLPAVSTGPLDPDWSPDGNWIAFSMRGDIWKVPAEGGEAIALTQGPWYHFEPAWSRDGTRIALTYEIDGDLEIGIVDANGGPVQRITDSPGYDLQPAWGADGRHLFFASRRQRGFAIYRVEVGEGNAGDATIGAAEPAFEGGGNQFQPAISPDGRWLAYVAPAPGVSGSGGIWVRALDDATEPRLVLAEETSYRAAPTWSADGSAIFYSSDAAGSNDIAVIPATGGNRVRLSEDPLDEFAVTASPNGSRIAFVSNHAGPTRLYTMAAGGGARGSWREVEITARSSRVETGTLRGRVLGPDGEPMPARIMVRAGDGRAYTEDGGFHRMMWVNKNHYAHTDGSFEVEVPAGPVTVDAMRGFEYAPVAASAEVPAGGTGEVTLQLGHFAETASLVERGWYASDMHVHDLHEGRFGLTQEMFFRQLEADDVRVANALIHMDGTKLMGRWDDLTGEPYRLSTDDRILYYTQEFRGSYGHVALLGLQRFIMPLIGGARGTPYAPDVLKLRHIDAAHEQGGIAGFVHPYNGPVDTPERAAGADIPVHVALGRGDFFDVVSIASLELESAEIYYRLLNCGFRIAATGGTDNFSDVWLDPSGGTARAYVHVQGAPPLTFGAWLDAVRAGRTFGTSGPLVFLTVQDPRDPESFHGLGEQIDLSGDDPTSLELRVEVASIAPLSAVEIVANGEVVQRWDVEGTGRVLRRVQAPDQTPPANAYQWLLTTSVDLPRGGWITARAIGPPSRYIGDAFPFAQTSPVYVVRDGVTYTSAEDARFLLEAVDILWDRVSRRAAWNTPAEEQAYREGIEQARAVYQRIIDASPER